MAKRKYYKVCRKTSDGRILSVAVSDPGLQAVYEVGKKTVPKHGYLFAFNNKEATTPFVGTGRVVYECSIEKAPLRRISIPSIHSSYESDMKNFWRLIFSGRKKQAAELYGWTCPPEGTVFCRSITLLKEIPRERI